jgi:hypothetical protein
LEALHQTILLATGFSKAGVNVDLWSGYRPQNTEADIGQEIWSELSRISGLGMPRGKLPGGKLPKPLGK